MTVNTTVNIESLLQQANAYKNEGKPSDALNCYQQVLESHPNHAETHQLIGKLQYDEKNFTKAIQFLKRSLALNPESSRSYVYLFKCYLHTCNWKEYQKFLGIIKDICQLEIENERPTTLDPFTSFALPWTEQQHLNIAKSHSRIISQKARQLTNQYKFSHQPKQKTKLKIGYVSGEFFDHNVSYLLQNLFNAHNRNQFEIYAYSHSPDDTSQIQQRIINGCDHFYHTASLTSTEIAQQIFHDGIDILVDLMGYTGKSRLEIFALRPAPIQVSYLGFTGSTGADFLDYIITDTIVTPAESQLYYSEYFVYLPDTYQINSQTYCTSSTPSRKSCRLPENAFVYCSFANHYKIEPTIFNIWMNLLKKTPGAVLWLLHESNESKANLKMSAKQAGVNPKRLIFAKKQPRNVHLARLALADLYLDTLAVNARTSASDALLMEVPILTCTGKTFSSRVCTSLLSVLSLSELIASDLTQYQKIATQLASKPEMLAQLKQKLKCNTKSSALYNTQKFVRNLESAYAAMWKLYSNYELPKQISIKN